MDEKRRMEMLEAIFRAVINQMVNRHILPTSQGYLTFEIQHLADMAQIPIEEFTGLFKEFMPESAMVIISGEAARIISDGGGREAPLPIIRTLSME